jgi:hypothetical protein
MLEMLGMICTLIHRVVSVLVLSSEANGVMIYLKCVTTTKLTGSV